MDPQPGQSEKMQEALKALGTMMEKAAPHFAGGGGNPVVSEARVGQQIGPIQYDPSGTLGQMPQPQAQPQRGVSQQSDALMSHLNPEGAATFSAIQGVSQFLQEWNQRKEQKTQAEASNIAGALMSAIANKDEAMMNAILTNPKATKVLDKVYKGWLQKDQASQQAPDPGVRGFEQGVQKAVQEKQQGGVQTPQAPKQAGGYLIPQAGPAQQLGAAKLSAESQAAQQDPARLLSSQMSSQERGIAERAAAELEISPATAKLLEAQGQQAILKETLKGYNDMRYAAAIQDSISKRSATTQEAMTKRSKMVEELRGGYRLKVANIIHEGVKKKSSEDTIRFKILKEEIDSNTRLLTNATSMWKSLTIAGKDDESKIMKSQMDSLDAKIRSSQEQLDSVKNRQIMQDMFMHLLSPEEKGEFEKESAPEDIEKQIKRPD